MSVLETRGLYALPRQKGIDGFAVHAQDAPDANSVEPAVMDQPSDRFGMDAQLVGDVANTDEAVRLLLRRWHRASTYNSSRLIASPSSRVDTDPWNFALTRPSRPTRNVHGPTVLSFARIVVRVDPGVDETDQRTCVLLANVVDHVDDRPADAALAVSRCRERHNERLMSRQRGCDGRAHQCAIGRNSRRQFLDAAVRARECRRVRRVRDRLEPRERRGERPRLEGAGNPDACLRPRDDASVRLDDQKDTRTFPGE